MRDDYEEKDQDIDEDDLSFAKVKKSAVLEPEDEIADVISGYDADFEAADNLSEEGDGMEGGFALYEGGGEEDDLSLQF